MDVAVIIPCHNAAAWLEATVASVLSQKEPPAEVIVIDDGSTDDSPQILDEFGGAIKVIRQRNAGLGAARNAGVAAATEQWVAFLDADDLHLPGTLQSYRLLHEAFPGATVLFADFTEFDERGMDAPHASRYLRDLARHAARSVGQNFLLEHPARILIERNGAFTPSCLVVRRDVLQSTGGFDESRDCQGAEDLDLYFRLLPTESVAVRLETVVHKRRHAGNMSRRAAQMRRAGERAVGRASAFYRERYPALIPIVDGKTTELLRSWASDDVTHRRPHARDTVRRLLKQRPMSLHAWWLLGRCLTTAQSGETSS